MCEKTVLIIFFVLIFVPLFVMVLYTWHNKKQNYNIKAISDELKKIDVLRTNETIIDIAISSINRVNGWNSLSAFYAGMYYCFNLWGFLFAVFSLICAVDTFSVGNSSAQIWTAISATITSITMCVQLFLRMDRKWRTFARKHYKARIITNDFLCRIRRIRCPIALIRQYSNKIVELEMSLRDDELL
ncbi:MAG: hypothetical protein II997_10080 [Clostridia bacterium]|nr:hypothetical protein [Clostridia bacterium]